MPVPATGRAGLLLLLLAGACYNAPAQELEPRAYSPNPVGANFVLVGYVLGALAGGYTAARMGRARGLALVAGTILMLFGILNVVLIPHPLWVTVATFLVYVVLTYLNYMREERERRRVRGAFSRYMSPALVEQLAREPGRLKLGGEMREMTLLFCDIRGFTTISEQFDAESLTRFIN